MRYLLDTNIVSELVSRKPNERVVEYINSLSQESIFLSVITIGEINSGIQNVQNEARKQLLLEWLYNDLFTKFERRIIEIDSEIMLVWGDINHQLKKTGNPLPVMDSLIGATCISKELTLVTRNEIDFKNLDIKIINPFA